ncbi:BspA family leucine-rich repeat surface protein [Ruminococcus albus]|uniref:Surface protein n=1 Tax=Ruminococcus albus TaxID=1264 RepID=A0A1I1M101_RUMAL|nr:BspA family leucine-rich repeat surface protein [Ruminococcus albus]SFC76263.1 surface protein [Ruminococcus albus]
MQVKRFLAVVMSLCMVAGTVSYGAPVITNEITAQAAEAEASCYSFDAETGVLTLRGEIDGDAIRGFSYKKDVKSVIAEEGTVFPEDCNHLFYHFINCTSMDLSNVDTSNVTDMESMFADCNNLTALDVSSFDTSNVTKMDFMFTFCEGLTELDVSGFDTSKVTTTVYMFAFCQNLTSLDLSGFDTSNVTEMSCMFNCCENLTTLDLSSFDTSNVLYMNSMFDNCQRLIALDLSGFDTSNVLGMIRMFRHCANLRSLDLSSFDTSNVTDMCFMFQHCYGLRSLDVSGFDTSNVTDMNYMFSDCHMLTSLDVSGFDTSNVTDMREVFSTCHMLTSLDLSGFDTSNVTDMSDMFSCCDHLKTLTLGENFKIIKEEAELPNGEGWVNVKVPSNVVSGSGKYAVIKNDGKNTYVCDAIIKNTYPKNIIVEYSGIYHQVRFRWDKVEGAEQYGVAVYLAGKWKVQAQNITGTSYSSPKNLTPGKFYRVAIAAKVNGSWDVTNAIKNAVYVYTH